MQIKSIAALSAVAGLMAVAGPAQAVIVVYSGPPIAITPNIDGLYLNVVTGASANGAVAGWDMNLYSNSTLAPTLTFWAPTGGGYVGTTPNVSALPFGTSIGPGSSFLSTPNISGGYLAPAFAGTTSYFGFRFVNEAGGTTHYGWAQLSAGSGGGFPASILAYAFESTPNTAIQAGVVPEPGTYALMLAGLAAVGGLAARRRKAEATA
jgi:hypothetical protein